MWAPRDRPVVVTGGAGFVGSHLCDALVAAGARVTCLDSLVATGGSTRNVDHLLGHAGFELVVADVVEWAAAADLRGVDTVFHLAASKNAVALDDPERDLAVNALAPLRLATRAAAHEVRKLVHVSTGSVYGETDGVQDERAPKRPVSPYGISKLAGESYCRVVCEAAGLDHTILRLYHVVGPRQDASERGGVVPIFARRALAGEPLVIHGDGGQTRSFTSVHDVVRASLLVAGAPGARGAELNCASGLRVSIAELAALVLRETGSAAGLEHAPTRPGDIRRFEVDNGRLVALGATFDRDWPALVREVIAWLRDEGPRTGAVARRATA